MAIPRQQLHGNVNKSNLGGFCARFVFRFKPLLGFSVPSFASLSARPSQALRSCPCHPMRHDSKTTTQRISTHLTHLPAVACECVRCALSRENGALPAQSWRSRSHAPKKPTSEAGQRDCHAVKARKMSAPRRATIWVRGFPTKGTHFFSPDPSSSRAKSAGESMTWRTR